MWIFPRQPNTNPRPSSRPVSRSTNLVPQSRATFRPRARTNIFSLRIGERSTHEALYWVNRPRPLLAGHIQVSSEIAEVAHKRILLRPIAYSEAEMVSQRGNVDLVVDCERL